MGMDRENNGAVGVMVLTRGKLMVLSEEMDLGDRGGTVGKLGVRSTRSYWVTSTGSSVF